MRLGYDHQSPLAKRRTAFARRLGIKILVLRTNSCNVGHVLLKHVYLSDTIARKFTKSFLFLTRIQRRYRLPGLQHRKIIPVNDSVHELHEHIHHADIVIPLRQTPDSISDAAGRKFRRILGGFRVNAGPSWQRPGDFFPRRRHHPDQLTPRTYRLQHPFRLMCHEKEQCLLGRFLDDFKQPVRRILIHFLRQPYYDSPITI